MFLDQLLVKQLHPRQQQPQMVLMPDKGNLIKRKQLKIRLGQLEDLFAAFHADNTHIIIVAEISVLNNLT